MLPPLRQRLLITAAVVIGGLVWMRAAPGLLPTDGAGGVRLIHAAAGPVVGLILAILAGLVAMGLAVIAGAVGTPLAAAFTFAASLMFLAAAGGGSLPFLWHATPAGYLPLLFETVVWFALLGLVVWLTARWRGPIRQRLPWLVSEPRATVASPLAGFRDTRSLLTAALCAGIAGVICQLMLRSWDIGQVLGSLVFAFLVGAMIAQVVSPAPHVGPILISPLLLAGYGYIKTWLEYGSADPLLAGAYGGSLHGFAWTLPIHFASAGVAGCVLGVGMAAGLVRGSGLRQEPPDAAGSHAGAV